MSRDRVDGRVPGDPVAVRLEHGGGAVVQVGVLDPRRREALGDQPVELRVACLVDGRALVGALEVDGVDRARSPRARSTSVSSHSSVGSSLKRSVG